MKKSRVIWDELARTELKEAFDYIKQTSLLQAEKVKHEIIIATKMLSESPEIYPPDKYRKDKDKRFRAFEKLSYRVSYLCQKKQSGY